MTLTTEHKQKISIALKKNYNKKIHSKEAREKARKTFLLTLQNPEIRKKWSRSGDKNNFWKGGKYKTTGGYIMVITDETRGSSNRKKHKLEHRLVMEQKLKRKLLPSEVVHHINGIKHDNRPENLVVTSPVKNIKYGSPLLKSAKRRIRELERMLQQTKN